MKTAYIVKGYRTAVAKSKRGGFRFKRADELAAETIHYMMGKMPEFDVTRIDDVIVGNAMPEGSQGLNMARIISLIGLNTVDVPGVTVNRFCSSGLETIGMAVAKIQSGMADCIIAGGTESMTSVPMTGFKPELNYNIVNAGHEDYYWGMGNTAEAVAEKFNISREAADTFSFKSHQKAAQAIDQGYFEDEIVPITVEDVYVKDGKKDGFFEVYHENGKLSGKGNYNDNVIVGPFEMFYKKNGNLKSMGNVKDGKKDGIWEYFNEDGTLKKTETYKDGKLVE